MTSSAPLRGTDLIDCAKANEDKGIELAAQRCGYGDDLAKFEQELQQACAHIGIKIQGFSDLLKHRQEAEEAPGEVVGPDTPTQL